MTIRFKPFTATAIVPETRQLVCVVEPSDPAFHGSVSVGRVLACGECVLDSRVEAGSRVLFSEDSGRHFTLADQPHVLLRRADVLAIINEAPQASGGEFMMPGGTRSPEDYEARDFKLHDAKSDEGATSSDTPTQSGPLQSGTPR